MTKNSVEAIGGKLEPSTSGGIPCGVASTENRASPASDHLHNTTSTTFIYDTPSPDHLHNTTSNTSIYDSPPPYKTMSGNTNNLPTDITSTNITPSTPTTTANMATTAAPIHPAYNNMSYSIGAPANPQNAQDPIASGFRCEGSGSGCSGHFGHFNHLILTVVFIIIVYSIYMMPKVIAGFNPN